MIGLDIKRRWNPNQKDLRGFAFSYWVQCSAGYDQRENKAKTEFLKWKKALNYNSFLKENFHIKVYGYFKSNKNRNTKPLFFYLFNSTMPVNQITVSVKLVTLFNESANLGSLNTKESTTVQ